MILVLGSTGFLGKRVVHNLSQKGMKFCAISRNSEFNLLDRNLTLSLFKKINPTYVLNCAAYVGGIQFGLKHSAELFHNNLHMTLNLLEASKESGVKRLVNPVSNCAYPAEATLFKENEFWNGPLHESVMVYGFARKASWVGSWAYAKQYGMDVINIILSNMYGPEDHFEEERSHALGALIMKFVEAKFQRLPEVVVWGSGKPIREWLHIDDGAEAMIRSIYINKEVDPINIGVGKGISIYDLAFMIKDVVGYAGDVIFDISKPDGAPYKTVDGSKGEKIFNWSPSRNFRQSIVETVAWYIENRGRYGY